MATSLVAELAEKLSSATNNFDIDESTIFVNTSADTVGIGTTSPSAKLDVRGSAIFNEGGLDADFRIEGDTETHLFFLDASTGRIGINSATPGVRFDVVGATKITGGLTVGVDDTGHDVKFFGATSGAYLEWDESADELEIRGGAATPGKLLLSTAETTVVDGNKLGQIDFQAPVDSAGTDAILVGASIYAEADDTFAADNNATELVFATGASEAAVEKVRITSDGKVGIGTSTPDTALSVAGLTTAAAIAIQAYTTTATQGSQLFLARSNNGTLGTQTAVDADDLLGGISFQGSYGSGFGTGAQIRGFADETFSGTAVGSTLRFYTADNTTTTLDERMRIDHNGKVGIGTTAPTEMLEIYNAASPSIQLNDGGDYQALFKLVGNDLEIRGSNGIIEFYTGNADGDSSTLRTQIKSDGKIEHSNTFAVTGTYAVRAFGVGTLSDSNIETVQMQHNGGSGFLQTTAGGTGTVRNMLIRAGTGGAQLTSGATSFTAVSDRRLKKDISALGDSLIKINKLEPVFFKWKESDIESEGFIAQDIFKIIPEVVTEGNDEVHEEDSEDCWKKGELKNPWMVSKERLIPFMVKAIQELSAEVTALKNTG